MALPADHPFWAAWALIVPLAAASALFAIVRAPHIAAPLVVELRGLAWVRRRGSVGCAALAAVLGVVASVVYGALLDRAPELAARLMALIGVGGAALATLWIGWLRRRDGLGGAVDLALLFALWGLGYGLVLPLLVPS